MKRIRFLLIIGVIFICTPFISYPHLFSQSLCRRTRTLGFNSLIQQLKNGEQREISAAYTDGSYVIKVDGKYLEPIAENEDFSYPSAFLSIRVYKESKPLGYYVIYPTALDYRGEFSARLKGGKFVDLGSLAGVLMREASDSLGIITSQSTSQFNMATFSQLEAKTAIYLYVKNYSSSDSALAAFIQTVDELKSSIDISASTIANILTEGGSGNFSQYGYYYWIAKHYPGGLETLQSKLSAIKKDGNTQGRSIKDIESEMVQHIRDRVSSREEISADILFGFLFAAGVLSVSDSKAPELDIILKAKGSFISLEEAEAEISTDIEKGLLGWVGVLDLDQLRWINTIDSKPIVNFILADIRKVFNYFLASRGGFAFAYRSGDEIGVYLPSAETEEAQVLSNQMRDVLGNIKYGIFRVEGNLSPEESAKVNSILSKYNAVISENNYTGEQLGIIRYGSTTLSPAELNQRISSLFAEINSCLGKKLNYQLYLGDKLKNGFAPTFSGGIISLANITGEDVLTQGFYRAQDTLGEAKRKGKDKIILGYDKAYRHIHTGDNLVSEEFDKDIDRFNSFSTYPLSQTSALTPRIYNEDNFRKEVYAQVAQGQTGLLLCLAPDYENGNGLHFVNEHYTLQGGDDVIKVLGYSMEKRFKEAFGNNILLGRRIDRIFIFIPGVNKDSSDYEKIVGIVSHIQEDFEQQVPLEIRFDVYGTLPKEGDADNPGLAYQRLVYTEMASEPLIRDLWGNTLSIYGVETREKAPEIEQELAEEALDNLVTAILIQRIIPYSTSMEEIKEKASRDLILKNIYGDYVSKVLDNVIAKILTQEIIPDSLSIEAIKEKTIQHTILQYIPWDYIHSIIEERNLYPLRESFLLCISPVLC